MSNPSIATTVALVATLHYGHVDKQGRPYLRHLLKVVSNLKVDLKGDEYIIVALLHDTLEDCDIDATYLLDCAFTPNVVEAVEILTHNDIVTYIDYIHKVKKSGSDLAIQVKIADNITNLEDLNLIPNGPSMKKRYETSLGILEGTIFK